MERGEEEVEMEGFFTGYRKTKIQGDQVMKCIRMPVFFETESGEGEEREVVRAYKQVCDLFFLGFR